MVKDHSLVDVLLGEGGCWLLSDALCGGTYQTKSSSAIFCVDLLTLECWVSATECKTVTTLTHFLELYRTFKPLFDL